MQITTANTGDHCSKCGAAITPDQRYCIECGEPRRENSLMTLSGLTAAQAEPAEVIAAPAAWIAPAAPAAKNRWQSGFALLSTIAVLLLAMGVGVLIGGKGGGSAAQQTPIVLGGGASTATGATDATATSAKSEQSNVADTAAAETKSGINADAIAKKNGVKLAEPDVELGDKCEKGSSGCNDSGEFDGEYFK